MVRISRQAKWFRAFLVASTAIVPLIPATSAFAQEQAVRSQPISYNIPAQPLSASLTAFARASGLKIAYPAALAQGKSSPAVRGSYSRTGALEQILAGSGLSYSFTGNNAVTIFAPGQAGSGITADGSTVLETIQVQGAGNVNRFVAAEASAGTKVSAPINETPYSVSVVTREQIEARDAQNLVDVLKYSPGVSTETGTTDRRFDLSKFSVRGFEPAYIVDGTRLYPNTGWYGSNPSLDPYLLERVEVLGGPASTLYGQASPGGTIAFQSKRPTETPLHEVFVGTGNHGRFQTGFDVGGPVTDDGTLLYRLTAFGLTTGTQVDYVKDERIAVAPAITWKPDEDTKLTVLTSYQRDPAKSGFSTLPWVGSYVAGPLGKIPRDFFWGEPDYNEFRKTQVTAGVEFEHRFNDIFTFRQNLKYVYVDGKYRDIFPGGLEADGRTLGRSFWGTDDSTRSINSDTQIQADFELGGAKHTLLTGFDYYSVTNKMPRYFWSGTTSIDIFDPVYGDYVPPSPWEGPYNGGAHQRGVYAQDYIEYGNLRLLGGVRKDWADTWGQSGTNPKSSEDSSAFTWRLGASYVFDSGLAPYVSYSTSFQPQGGATAPDRGSQRFKPTTGEQYEIGLKYQPQGLDSFFTLSAFDITQQNVLTGDPDFPGFSIQKGEVRSRGITAAATLSLASNVNLLATYTYLNLETTKATVDETNDPVGKVPWYAPNHVGSLWVDYTFDDGALEGLRIGSGVRYVGSGYIDSSETLKLPSYFLVDIGVKYDFGAKSPDLKGLEGSINVSNLFDKNYLATCLSVGGGCRYGDARTVTAQLKYRW